MEQTNRIKPRKKKPSFSKHQIHLYDSVFVLLNFDIRGSQQQMHK